MRSLHRDYVCQIDFVDLPEKTIDANDIQANYAKMALDATLEVFDRFNWKYDEKSIKNILVKDQDNFFKMKF